MKYIIIVLSLLSLTGCASGCHTACVFGIGPGNSVFDSYADYSDNQDPCQFKGKPAGYELPKFCGSARGQRVRVTRINDYTYSYTTY